MIIISSKDIFDYSAGEPEDREAVTVLRALEVCISPFLSVSAH